MSKQETTKKGTKIQANIDAALGEVLGMVSMHVRGQVVRNALNHYLRSPEGRLFYQGFGIDLDADMASRVSAQGIALEVPTAPIAAQPVERDLKKTRHHGFDRGE